MLQQTYGRYGPGDGRCSKDHSHVTPYQIGVKVKLFGIGGGPNMDRLKCDMDRLALHPHVNIAAAEVEWYGRWAGAEVMIPYYPDTLYHFVSKELSLPLDPVTIMRGVASAVCHLHSLVTDLPHGHLSLSNISIHEGKVILTDPGNFFVRDYCEQEAAYLAPEELELALLTIKVDSYAFGMIMNELYSGKLSYHDFPSWKRLGGEVRRGLRPALSPDMPADLQVLCQRCWLSDPTERPSMTEIQELLLARGP
jgi:hypothetical protein